MRQQVIVCNIMSLDGCYEGPPFFPSLSWAVDSVFGSRS
jgi:hypothetical protein